VVRTGGEKEYNDILSLYNNCTDDSTGDCDNLLLALSSPTNPSLCQNTLKLISNRNTTYMTSSSSKTLKIDDDVILGNLQDISNIMKYNFECREIAWEYYKTFSLQAWAQLGDGATDQIGKGIAWLFGSWDTYNDVFSWIATNSTRFTEYESNMILTMIKINIDMLNFNVT